MTAAGDRWRWRRLLAAAGLAAISVPAIYQLSLLAYAVASRFAYPYDLEWMEGGLLDHAARIQDGAGIYVPPSIDFVPYLYTPLYPGLLAILGGPLELGYTLGRAVAVLSLAVALAAIATAGLERDRDAGSRRLTLAAGALGAGLAASAYPFVEGWYDLVRGDMMFVAMVLAGMWLLSRELLDPGDGPGERPRLRIAAIAALLALSFFCKQHGIWFVAAGGLNLLLWRRWRDLAVFVGVAGAIGLGFSWLLERATGGWYWTYIYEVLRGHDFNMPRFWSSFGHMFGRAPIATAVLGVAVAAVAVGAFRRRRREPGVLRFATWLAPLGASVAVGALGWGHQWAHFNAYVPMIFVSAAAVAAAIPAIAAALPGIAGRGLAVAAAALIAIELLTLAWSPSRWIPTPGDRAAGDRLIAIIAEIDGEVLIPYHPWYARLAGKETGVHRMGLMDVQYGNRYPVVGLGESFRRRRYAAVILDKGPDWSLPGLRGPYRKSEPLPPDARPRTVTGAIVAPREIWRPVFPPAPGESSRGR